MSDRTDAVKCPDCGRKLIVWDQAKFMYLDLVGKYVEAVDTTATAEEREAMKAERMHEHEFVRSFLHWLAATEKIDVKMLIELLSDMARIQMVIFAGDKIAGFTPPHTDQTPTPIKH